LAQRSSIAALSSLGFDVPKIAELTSCDSRTIQHWIDRFNQHGNLDDEPRSGRPPLTDTDDNQAIVSMAEEIRFVTPKQIRSELQLHVSARTVRRVLDQAGLFGRVARVSYPFTAQNVSDTDLSSLPGTVDGMNPNGTMSSSVTRHTLFWVEMAKCGFSV